MELSLAGKSALVCGSSQGIGRAAAEELARLGASVTLLARDPDKLRAVATGLPAPERGQAHGWASADFADPAAVEATVAGLTTAGGGRIYHVLVNNTGGPAPGPALDAAPAAFEAAFRAHLICNQVLTRAVVPGMRKSRYGRIVNIISTSVKQPIPNLGVSNTVRAAVAAWAKTLSIELGPHGITVNNVLPGYTRTARLEALVGSRARERECDRATIEAELIETIPAGRFAEPGEVAAAVAFLASPAAGYISGINLPVDGGRLGTL
ncbi:MAG TPA: SDR family oxidoreductase [Phycisphaerales bacterium]|nr:SDR family oxidoreductase [Phycisphaerales bacterium]